MTAIFCQTTSNHRSLPVSHVLYWHARPYSSLLRLTSIILTITTGISGSCSCSRGSSDTRRTLHTRCSRRRCTRRRGRSWCAHNSSSSRRTLSRSNTRLSHSGRSKGRRCRCGRSSSYYIASITSITSGRCSRSFSIGSGSGGRAGDCCCCCCSRGGCCSSGSGGGCIGGCDGVGIGGGRGGLSLLAILVLAVVLAASTLGCSGLALVYVFVSVRLKCKW